MAECPGCECAKRCDGFIREAIAEKADQHEPRDDCHTIADKRLAKIVETGKTVPWNDLPDY